MWRVYGYLLQRRGIDKEVPDAFAYRNLVYECERYHNAVFVGTDKAGTVRHIHKRSTAAQGGFKGNAPGSSPEYSFHWHGGGDVLYLFEAPIDMLSFISLYKPAGKARAMRHPAVFRTRFCGRCWRMAPTSRRCMGKSLRTCRPAPCRVLRVARYSVVGGMFIFSLTGSV